MRNRFRFLAIFFLMSGALTAMAQDTETGFASYYGDEFQGRRTAYGDTYDKNKLTAAHKRHPYGTMIKVTRLDNKKSVTVKVTDKGPYVKGRVVDLSRKAAEKLGMLRDGSVEVEVQIVKRVTKEDEPVEDVAAVKETQLDKELAKEPKADQPAEYDFKADNVPSETTKTEEAPKATTAKKETSVAKTEKPAATKVAKDETTKTSRTRGKLVGKDYKQYGLYKIILERPSQKGYGVQVASLTNYENVLRQVADLQAKWFEEILVSIEKGDNGNLYKIILGPFETESAAKNYAANIKKKQKVNGFVVNLSEIKY